MQRSLNLMVLYVALTATCAYAQNTFPSSGNVGIGTTSPVANLQIASTSSTPAGLILGNGNDGTDGYTSLNLGLSALSGGYATLQAIKSAGTAWGNLVLNPNAGSVGIGLTNPAYLLDVAGGIHAAYAIVASGGVTFADGTSQTTAFNSTLCGGDYADSVDVSGERKSYEPGDVLVLTPDGKGDVDKSAEPYSTMVAGIYSTKPGTVGRRQTTALSKATDEIPMAMVGIVPTRVSAENGPIRRGDLLVTASLKGYAMKGTDRSRMLGAVVGKAMGSLESGTGMIEVLVTLQ